MLTNCMPNSCNDRVSQEESNMQILLGAIDNQTYYQPKDWPVLTLTDIRERLEITDVSIT